MYSLQTSRLFCVSAVIGSVFSILCIDAAQTDFNERINDKRRKCVNKHNLSDLERISDRIRLKYNAPNPYSADAIELYIDCITCI